MRHQFILPSHITSPSCATSSSFCITRRLTCESRAVPFDSLFARRLISPSVSRVVSAPSPSVSRSFSLTRRLTSLSHCLTLLPDALVHNQSSHASRAAFPLQQVCTCVCVWTSMHTDTHYRSGRLRSRYPPAPGAGNLTQVHAPHTA